jgi:hypothetical protein
LLGSALEGLLTDESSDEVLESARKKRHDLTDLLIHVNDARFTVGSARPVVQGDHVVPGGRGVGEIDPEVRVTPLVQRQALAERSAQA